MKPKRRKILNGRIKKKKKVTINKVKSEASVERFERLKSKMIKIRRKK